MKNGKKPFFAYRSFWKEFDAMKRFAQIGVKQFAVFGGNTTNSLGEPYCQYDPIWKWHDTYDFTPFDEQMNDVFRICPDAEILCLIDLNSPLWLARQLYVDSYAELTLAECNVRWKKAVSGYVRAFVKYAEQKYGDRISCYIMMCGKTDEWMDLSQSHDSEEKYLAYCQWCKKQGFPEPEDIPGINRRNHISHEVGHLQMRDPVTDAEALRYWRFHSENNADTILEFASIIRSEAVRPVEIGVFYGYILQLEYKTLPLAHLAYEKVESSPDIDFVISPGDYRDRPMGGGSGFMTPNGTVKLHRKDCLYEIDHRTTSANMQLTPFVELKWMDRWKDLDEDRAGLRREFCRSLFHGSHLWWFDMWGKFYEDQENIDVIAKCREIWEKYADRSFAPEAEVALVVDPESTLYFGPNVCGAPLMTPILKVLNRLGTPYEVYSLNDLPHIPERIRFAVFTGVVKLDERNRTELERFAAGRQFFWNGPSGLTDGKIWRELSLPGFRFPDHSAVTADILRRESLKAGVHFFTESFCPVWYGRDLLSIHCAEGGKMKIVLPKAAGIAEELFSGKRVAVNGTEFEYEFKKPETVLFKLSAG